MWLYRNTEIAGCGRYTEVAACGRNTEVVAVCCRWNPATCSVSNVFSRKCFTVTIPSKFTNPSMTRHSQQSSHMTWRATNSHRPFASTILRTACMTRRFSSITEPNSGLWLVHFDRDTTRKLCSQCRNMWQTFSARWRFRDVKDSDRHGTINLKS